MKVLNLKLEILAKHLSLRDLSGVTYSALSAEDCFYFKYFSYLEGQGMPLPVVVTEK
jgi:hypothetical protein